jgi:hypothetical protein
MHRHAHLEFAELDELVDSTPEAAVIIEPE